MHQRNDPRRVDTKNVQAPFIVGLISVDFP